MGKRFLLLLGSLAGLDPASAVACRIYTPGADQSVIHRELPHPLSPDLFVAEVEFEHPEAGWSELFNGTRARVRRVIQGTYRGNVVIVRDALGPDEMRITCYAPVRDGGSGIVVGRPIGSEGGLLVIKPTFEGRGRPEWAPERR